MINVTPPGRDKLVGRLLRLPLDALPAVPLWVMSGPIRGKRWIAGVGVHGYLLGTYERDKQVAFAEAVTEGSLVFDFGAHIGFYSLLAARSGAAVIAIEPNPHNASFVRKHLSLNGYQGEVLEVAVSDATGTSHFVNGQSSSTGHLAAQGTPVPTITLDRLSEIYGYPDVVKIDIEGAEVAALRGAAKTLEHTQVLFVAAHSDDLSDACTSILEAARYRVTYLDDPHHEIVARKSGDAT